MNISGILSTATARNLYKLSLKNGCNLSWTQWSGGPTNIMAGGTNTLVGTVGSILALEFGTDIALPETVAAGVQGTFQFKCNVTVKNVNQTDTITSPTLKIVTIDEGLVTIEGNKCIKQIAPLSIDDVLRSKQSPTVDYNDLMDAYGGNFMTGLKDFGKKIWEGVKKVGKHVLPVAKELLPLAKKLAPILLKEFPKILPLLGLGEGGGYAHGSSVVGGRRRRVGRPKKRGRKKKKGGILIGGELISRAELRRRMM